MADDPSTEQEKNAAGVDNPTFVADEPAPPYDASSSMRRRSSISSGSKEKRGSVDSVKSGKEKDVESLADEHDRDNWGNPIEFLMSCISMSVGLGNVWRFPTTAYSNGGGAFLIPYLFVLLLIGRPIYYLEMCMGQFSSSGQVKVWAMAPLFKGIGYASAFGVACVVSYYCSLMGLSVFYFFASFSKDLPWTVCKDEWEECVDGKPQNDTIVAELYYRNEVFPQTDSIDNGLGAIEWRLCLCLLLSWILVCAALIRGVKSAGKVAYFTAIFPYVVMFILLIRGVTLDGAWDGIKAFITPDWEKIYDPDIWFEAVGQCFFSLSTGFGPIIMLSSFNSFDHNVYRDALVISFMDTFTSLLAGCTIFSVLGNLAKISGKEVKDVVGGGPGIAFISYPAVIAEFGWLPQLFAVLFFLMLFTLGMGSATNLAGGLITIMCDQFPKVPRWAMTIAVCSSLFLVGLIYVTPGGHWMLDLVDLFGANFVIYITAMIEVGAIAWIYGLNNVIRDIEFMTGRKTGWYWKACWGFIIPVGLFVILIYVLATFKRLTYEGNDYPDSAIACGWALTAISLALIVGWGLHGIYTRKSGSFKEKFFESLKPSKQWGPKSPKMKAEWERFCIEYANR